MSHSVCCEQLWHGHCLAGPVLVDAGLRDLDVMASASPSSMASVLARRAAGGDGAGATFRGAGCGKGGGSVCVATETAAATAGVASTVMRTWIVMRFVVVDGDCCMIDRADAHAVAAG